MKGTALIVSLFSVAWKAREELGAAYVAAALERDGRTVGMVLVGDDHSTGFDSLRQLLIQLQPSLVGIGCSHAAFKLETYQSVSRLIREIVPTAHVTAGGYHATFNAVRLLASWLDLDSVVIGEGEETVVEMMARLDEGRSIYGCPGVRTRREGFRARPPTAELDTLAPPLRNPTGVHSSTMVSISTSRGCTAHCTFCNVPRWTREHGGGWRGRSPVSVVNEVAALYASGARRFWIVDSSYEDPIPSGFVRMREIADLLIERRLPISYYVFMRAESLLNEGAESLLRHLIASGLRRIFIGVESGRAADLVSFAKSATPDDSQRAIELVERCGIVVRTGFIMFTPQSSFTTLRLNLSYMKSCGFLASTADLMTRLELYAGAAVVNTLSRQRLLAGDCWDSPFAYRFVEPRLEPLAHALGRLRWVERPDFHWESLHLGRQLGRSALLDAHVSSNKRLRLCTEAFNRDVEELWQLQTDANEVFFTELLNLAESGWNVETFQSLVRRDIEGVHYEVGETCDTLMRAFMLEMEKGHVDIVY